MADQREKIIRGRGTTNGPPGNDCKAWKYSSVPSITPQARKAPKGNKSRIETAVLRIRMAGGLGGGSENLPPTRLADLFVWGMSVVFRATVETKVKPRHSQPSGAQPYRRMRNSALHGCTNLSPVFINLRRWSESEEIS